MKSDDPPDTAAPEPTRPVAVEAGAFGRSGTGVNAVPPVNPVVPQDR